MLKRLFDIIVSLIGLIVLFPFLIILAVAIMVETPGGIFYMQTRVGKNNKDFKLFKFRSMAQGSDKKGLLTVGKDARITKVGHFIRKYKLDEFAQLINVLKGDMSLVGPRPEVRKYVELYNDEQIKVLNVKPGITDYASIEYFDENSLLGASKDPEKTYIEEVMPHKLELNKKYISNPSIAHDINLIFKTIQKIFK
ncbi:MAG: sugar transferase [Bacteroidales bacterium]|nr:sugar transferase [Bacteroidales bacterium]